MSLVETLRAIEDARKGSRDSEFNGFLEDYLELIEGEHKPVFNELLALNSEVRILVGYSFNVNEQVISNQIIRYKDTYKLPKRFIRIPYILYGTGIKEFALLLADGHCEDDYIFAKALYYCITEQFGLLEEYRNDVLALSFVDEAQVVDNFRILCSTDPRIGVMQRALDRLYFPSFPLLFEKVMAIAEEIKTDVQSRISEHGSPRAPLINTAILKWYFLKKFIYVQYMTNRELLFEVHQNDVKSQRQQAKRNADQIPFIPYSELWRMS